MAQHRTKEDKLKAQIRREQMLYTLEKSELSTDISAPHTGKTNVQETGIFSVLRAQDIRIDLTRSAVSLSIVLGLLVGAFFALQ